MPCPLMTGKSHVVQWSLGNPDAINPDSSPSRLFFWRTETFHVRLNPSGYGWPLYSTTRQNVFHNVSIIRTVIFVGEGGMSRTIVARCEL